LRAWLAAPALSGVEITVHWQRLLGKKLRFDRAAFAIDLSNRGNPGD
jgi:hypothetical protein